MDPLPPIPSSPLRRWRLLRQNVAHVIVFAALCAGVIFVWRRLQAPTSFIGQVETIQTVVSSRDAGFITNLWILPLQEIKAGDLVAEVITTDPRTVNNRLEVIRDRMRLMSLEMEPILSRNRTALAYEQLSVDCDRVGAELAVARVKLEQARSQFARDENFFKTGNLAAELFDLSRRNRDSFEVEVIEKSNLVHRTEKTLDRLKSMTDSFVPGGENDPIKQALAVEEDKMKVFEAKLTPLRLIAPTNGVVTTIHRHAGEQGLAGEPIATITGTNSERILGYLPENFPVEPRVGMAVQVRTRSFKRRNAPAQIIGVSPQLEPVTNVFVAPLVIRHAFIPSMGRIVSVALPRELKLRPGEPVDVSLLSK
jgi:multidrug resistance efflux pump